MSWAIEVNGLSKQFGDFVALKSLHLWVPEGALYGFVGPNGAGKTTTLRLLLGLSKANQGSIRILGEPLEGNEKELKRKIGVVFDTPLLFDYLTVREHLIFAGKMFGLEKATMASRVPELLSLLELETSVNKLIVELSSGTKKKVALSVALLHHPQLLILDEPFEGLDPVSRRVLEDVLRDMVGQQGSVLLTSHSLELVERLCSEVTIIDHGRVVATGNLSGPQAETGSLEKLFFEHVESRRTRPLSWLHRSDGSNQ